MQACVGAKVLQSALYDVQCTCTGPRSLESALCVSKGDAICVYNGLVCVMCIGYSSICLLRLEIVSGECPVWEEGWPGPGQTFTSHPHVASTRAEHSVNWIQNRSRNK